MAARVPIAVAAVLALCAAAAADERVRTIDGDAAIDWTAGVMTTPGAAAGDLRAPSASVARVGAERAARAAARARLRERARALPLATGGTVGERLDADEAAAARFAAALEHTRASDVHYSTDGSVVVRERLALEAVRLALVGAPPPPAAGADAPTAAIVDATALTLAPALGTTLVAGGERYAGPTVFYRKGAKIRADGRLGPRVVELGATAASDGELTVSADPAAVARLRKAGALVVVVLPGSKP